MGIEQKLALLVLSASMLAVIALSLSRLARKSRR